MKKENNKNKFIEKIKSINFKDKKIIILTITSIIALLLLATTSFAMLLSNASSANTDLFKTGVLTINLGDASEGININPAKPVSDAYGKTLTPYRFTIASPSTTTYKATYKIILTNEEITSTKLTNEQVKKFIKYQINDEVPKLLSNTTNNVLATGGIEPGQTKEFTLRLWIAEEATIDMEDVVYKAKVSATGEAVREFGPNVPVLAKGMIPVIYDEANDIWEVADTTKEWYNYEEQNWANAVTTSTASYRTASPGTEIPMTDINSMWVWIPRYKYKIPSNMGSSNDVTTPPQIDVEFESGIKATGVDEATYRTGIKADGTNSNYYTHPAFRNIDNITYDASTTSRGAWDKELTGIWVGKFETGGNSTTPLIKPDIVALTNDYVATQFDTALKFAGGKRNTSTGEVTFSGNETYGLTSTTDTHMMKNTEWGAVAILSQSKYGKMGNNNYSGTNKEVYQNNSSSYYTGRSCGYAWTYNIESEGTYKYNVDKEGTGASTTGTIYGIYDMSGGAAEFTMGNWEGIVDYTGFSILPSIKYCDKYTGTASAFPTKEKAILGDATWETMRWYEDIHGFVDAFYTFLTRGSYYDAYSGTGVFSNDNFHYLNAYSDGGVRTVLIP